MKIFIEVKGGLVQAVYANSDVEVDVVDLDVSDFPDEDEQKNADAREAEMKRVIAQKGWRNVW